MNMMNEMLGFSSAGQQADLANEMQLENYFVVTCWNCKTWSKAKPLWYEKLAAQKYLIMLIYAHYKMYKHNISNKVQIFWCSGTYLWFDVHIFVASSPCTGISGLMSTYLWLDVHVFMVGCLCVSGMVSSYLWYDVHVFDVHVFDVWCPCISDLMSMYLWFDVHVFMA